MACFWVPRKLNWKIILCTYNTFLNVKSHNTSEMTHTNVLARTHRQFTGLTLPYSALRPTRNARIRCACPCQMAFFFKENDLEENFFNFSWRNTCLTCSHHLAESTTISFSYTSVSYLKVRLSINKLKCKRKPVRGFWISDLWGTKNSSCFLFDDHHKAE